MKSEEYRLMYNIETTYWWFRNLHDILTDMLRPYVKPVFRVLDAGCGTGGLMLRLGALTPHVYGFDISRDAAAFWGERGTKPTSNIASINEIPYADNTFDAVISADILESDGVDDKQAYRELVRVTQPNGVIIIVIPAYQWMMTKGHHQAVNAIRRYNKQSAQALTNDLPVTVQRITHGYAGVFPMVAGTRLYNRWQEQRGDVAITSELNPLPPLMNYMLYEFTNLERYALRFIDMPFGSSLIMIAQKQA